LWTPDTPDTHDTPDTPDRGLAVSRDGSLRDPPVNVYIGGRWAMAQLARQGCRRAHPSAELALPADVRCAADARLAVRAAAAGWVRRRG